MRGGPAFLQFDWSKASLSMDLLVFVFSHTKTSFNSSRHRTHRAAFYVRLEIFHFKPSRENLAGLLFCLDLSLSRSTDHRDCNFAFIISAFHSPHAAGSCRQVYYTSYFYLSVNMYKTRTVS